MAVKSFDDPLIGHVSLYKRKASRNIRVSVASDGNVRVTLPYFVPYRAGLEFAQRKASWIIAQQAKTEYVLTHGDRIGKAHHLYFQSSTTATRSSARVHEHSVIITYPIELSASDDAVQQTAKSAGIKVLRAQAEALLPGRLAKLARQTNLQYRSVRFRQLKSRWGSCSSHGDITLNIYLMQLPWELIDYVLIHELLHTKFPHHGAAFWEAFATELPEVSNRRRQIRSYPASLRTMA